MSKPSTHTCRIRPILMADPMAKAIRDQRKTQTRRAVRGVEWTESMLMGVMAPDAYNNRFKPSPPATCTMSEWRIDDSDTTSIPCPYGTEGDMLWVREAWARDPKDETRILYRADRTAAEWRQYAGEAHPIKWSPSILMPKTASRSLLRITGITVELLQDISDWDAIAEGVTTAEDGWDIWVNYMWHGHPGVTPKMVRSWPYQFADYLDARGSFASLIARISGADTWNRNPCVWVITFELVEGADHDI